jgi:tripartite ATP-independent transporter DctP family solute receptor
MFLKSVAAAAVAVSLSVLSAIGAFAATELKWAHVYEAGTPYHTAAIWAAEEIKKKTDGRVEIKVFPASSLGKEVEINEGLTIGSIDIIYTGANFVQRYYGPIAISDYPFMLRGYDHWVKYRDSDLFEELTAGYNKKTGNHVAGLVYYGARHVTSNKPILKPEDMKNLKIRVPNSPVMLIFPRAVGANPTPMAFSEVYLALQQGVVDAQENPLPTIKFKKFYEVQSNISLTGHLINSLVVIVSDKAVKKLGKDEQVVKDVLKQAAAKASDEIIKAEKELAEWFRSKGIAVHEVDKKPFQEAVKPFLTGKDVPYTMEHFKRIQAL